MFSSSNLRHCHVLFYHEFRELVVCAVTFQKWVSIAISSHSKSACAAAMQCRRFSIGDCYKFVIHPYLQGSEMSFKGSATFPGHSHDLKLGKSSLLGCHPCWRGLGRLSATTSGLVYPRADGSSVFEQAEYSGRQFCTVGAEEGRLQEDRDRSERRLWEKGLRKSIYESLRKDRITVELFPELSFALDGNYYPKLVPLLTQKINRLLDTDAVNEIAPLLDFLGVSLNPHLVGEVLKSRDDWEKSLRFFVWTKYQPEYEHTAHTYNLLFCNLAKVKNEKPNDVVASLDLLQEMVQKGLSLSIFAVNIVIDRLCKVRKTRTALKVLRELEANGVSFDLVTYNSVISGLGKAGKLEEVFELLEEMEQKNVKPDLVTYNSVIHCLGNSNRWREACRVFDELSDRGLTPDVVTYNSLICALYKGGQPDEAFKVFGLMALRGCEADVITYNTLIYGLARASRLDDAFKIFTFMKRKNCNPDVITYNTLISEFIARNRFAEVSGLLVEMKEMGCTPDRVTRKLLTEIGQADRINVLWKTEAATDNEYGSRCSSFGEDNGIRE